MKPAYLITIPVLAVLSAFAIAAPVTAAAPDGAGPWADSVISFTQGPTKNGGAVPAIRSNPDSALGVAENDTVEGNFVSLGFGGRLTLKFDNPVRTGVLVVEATNPNYPLEKASVEVSANGTDWTLAGSLSQDGQVALPQSVSCARYVRITDISNKDDFADDTADAYDVDGVQAQGTQPCDPPPTPTPSCKPEPQVVISGNGAGSHTTVVQSRTTRTSVSTGSVSKVTTQVKSVVSTGGNKVSHTTGGTVKVTSGAGTSTTSVTTVTGGTTVTVGH